MTPVSPTTTDVNPVHLSIAELLLTTLKAMNAADAQEYAYDNTILVAGGNGTALSPYAHVRAALLHALTGVTGGNRGRAVRLLDYCECGEDVAYNLALLVKDDAARVPQVHAFDDTEQALAAVDRGDTVSDGDVLSVPSETVVGILLAETVIAVTTEQGEFSRLDRMAPEMHASWWSQVQDGRYVDSYRVARETATAMVSR